MSPPLSREIEEQVRELLAGNEVQLVTGLLLNYGEENHHRLIVAAEYVRRPPEI